MARKQDVVPETGGIGSEEDDGDIRFETAKEQPQNFKQLVAFIQTKFNELSDRIDEIDQKSDSQGKALLKMVEITFDTPDRLMPELGSIPIAAVAPMASALTLDGLASPDVRSGRITLLRKGIIDYLRVGRSGKGVQAARAAKATFEEIRKTVAQEENVEEAGSMGKPDWEK